jgi:hypothetical protein
MTSPVLAQANPNPRVIPNGHQYEVLAAQWWQWALKFGTDLPFFNTGGAVDLSAGQSGNVWFLAGANYGLTEPRTGEIPTGTSLFFPVANLLNDYPCPPEFGFEPNPGETLEAFLQRTGNEFLDYYLPDPSELSVTVDGVVLTGLPNYRVTSSLFQFQADPALGAFFDPCINGDVQDAVTVGYWLWLPPLPPGEHTIHFEAGGLFGQDVTYVITVVPGRSSH